MILPYQKVKALCESIGLVEPSVERSKAFGMSYGLSSAGYDVRVAESLWVASGEFALASTMEHFNIPHDVMPHVVDKSSWARRGLCVQNTVIEPGWRGYLTIELTNHSMDGIAIQKGMPICQLVFHQLSEPTQLPYNGKYQDQPHGITPAIMEWDSDG